MSFKFWDHKRDGAEAVLVYAARMHDGLEAAGASLPIRIVSQVPQGEDYIAVLGADEPMQKAMPRHIPVIVADDPELLQHLSEAILYIRAHQAISG